MQCIDYSNAFIITSGDNKIEGIRGNSPRFQIESRCRLIYENTGKISDYYQCYSCKSEVTYREKNFFTTPNYDFTPIFSEDIVLQFRRYAKKNDEYMQYQHISKVFGSHEIKTRRLPESIELKTGAEIVKATKDCRPLVAQTEIWNETNQIRAIIEYPIKTMNIHVDSDEAYQPDTGVVLFPDISKAYDLECARFRLAYVIFNTNDYVEFIVEEPECIKQIKKTRIFVYHYSGIRKSKAINRIFSTAR